MFGSLPLRYRIAVWAAGLLSFAGIGVWVAVSAELPLLWPSAALLSAVLGAVAVAVFVHLLEGEAHRQYVRRR